MAIYDSDEYLANSAGSYQGTKIMKIRYLALHTQLLRRRGLATPKDAIRPPMNSPRVVTQRSLSP